MSSDSREPDPRRSEASPGGETSSGGAPRKRAGEEDVAALVRSIETGVQEKERALETRRGRRRSPVWYVLLVLALLGNAYLWIGQPSWLGIGVGAAPTVEEEEGMLRYRMYVQARQIEAYQRQHGDLPEALEDAGPPKEGLRYRRTGANTWELMGEVGRARLVLHSAQPLDEFLGRTAGAESDGGSDARGDGP